MMHDGKPLAVSLLIFLACLSVGSVDGATATLDYTTTYQTIEGFGGGLCFRKYPWFHPEKEALYDSIFNVARINVVRIGNYYDQDLSEEHLVEVPMMREIQQRWPEVKTMLTSWTPPSFLKSNNSIAGGNELNDTGTLKKNNDNLFMYQEYGCYWLKSMQYFMGSGMKIDWVSIQNEPDCAAWYEGCVMGARETSSIASYGKALNAVYTTLQENMPGAPPLVGPDIIGLFDTRLASYLTSPELDRNQLDAYCHHLYDYCGPEWMKKPPLQFPDKPMYQTEFLINEGEHNRTWFDHAVYIHNSLAIENVSMYCVFGLAYKPASTHCLFSIDTLGGTWYTARPTYYMFKHFSRSIRRGWKRCGITVDNPELLVSAYRNTVNDSLAIVLLNTGSLPVPFSVRFQGKHGEYYQTTDEQKYVHAGSIHDSAVISCESRSITTIELYHGSNGITRPPLVKTKPLLSILNMQQHPGGGVSVSYCAPSGRQAELTVLDIRGKVYGRWYVKGRGTAGGVHRFKCRFADGAYLLRLRCKYQVRTVRFSVCNK